VTPRQVALAMRLAGSPSPDEPADRPSPTSSGGGADLEMILIEERDDAVYFARVRNLGKLMSNRRLHVHKDVLENLADLVLALVGEEGSDGSGSRG
jgi:hypothetical protein